MMEIGQDLRIIEYRRDLEGFEDVVICEDYCGYGYLEGRLVICLGIVGFRGLLQSRVLGVQAVCVQTFLVKGESLWVLVFIYSWGYY